ncbi:DNA polymerase-3 subunit delta' [Clostridium punense]|uniref:DNA polymerase III subunit delta' n=1 Tax=Clostridium punense TaxID=1054297 RepID=A0ABS4KAL8_9CLOT|nr:MULTISPECIES: DNA polymerase III subunit delta' [Clostridium]EQB89268.1 hypothetical protein M918_21150 [Clostridium sp. BL8]MBP2024226.1 DNA polymerase-3 subunit delta' [Clostridium punense]
MGIIGHEQVLSSFTRAINSNRISHAHILVGDDGIGKSPLATAIAIKLIGKEENREYIDIVHWTVEKNKASIGVGAIRELIQEINKKPYEVDKKVIVIHQGDKMTAQAQNALLKTIEEPPKNVFMFILCENLESILDTIKSRCQIHRLNPLKESDMRNFLKLKYPSLDETQLKVVEAFSDGIPGKAETLIHDDNFNKLREAAIEILGNIKKVSTEELLGYEDYFTKLSDSWQSIINIIITILRDTIIYKEVGDENLIINVDKLQNIKELANMFSLSKLNDIISIVEDTRRTLEKNVNLSLTFTVMLLKIQEA